MMTIKVNEEQALDMLMERVEFWTGDLEVQALFRQMYESYIDCGCFDGGEFDTMQIVDNDYINWTSVICEGEADFDKLKEIYNEQGIGDCSCEIGGYSYIEAVDDGEDPQMFLVRH